MKKSDIIGRVADRMRLRKSVAEGAVDTVLETIAEALAKEEAVRIAGFGTFATKRREARTGRNPATGESVAIAASKAPSFKAGKALRDAVNTGRNPAAGDGGDDRDLGQRAHGDPGASFDVSDWPGGVEPVWSVLEAESARALRVEPLAEEGAVHLADDLTEGELAGSAFVRNALVLLGEMDDGETLWMGSHGNLTMKSVTRLRTLMSWPGLEATEQFRTGKTYREQAIGELHLLRLVAGRAGLIRSSALWFELTPLGRTMLEPGRRGGLQALLFHDAFWGMDLSKFVSGRPRSLPGWWPQGDIGVVLWSLSAVGNEWRNARSLTALCTVRDDSIPTARWDPAAMMFARHILDPLRWFGLVECRMVDVPIDMLWRKTVLFDRFLSFDVRLAGCPSDGH